MVTMVAMNSSKFIDNLPRSSVGSCQRQAMPSEVKPPIPNGHASEIAKDRGMEKVMWSILVPIDDDW